MPHQRLAKFGWIPDLPDYRDKKFAALNRGFRPAKVDLRDKMPGVYNQGDLGCCTAAATAAAYVYLDMLNGKAEWDPSLIFLYYNTRAIEGAVKMDRGAQIRNSIKAAVEYGICPSGLCPFDPARFAVQPSPTAFGNATTNQVESYQRLDENFLFRDMLLCLAGGVPFVFGASLYENFEELDSGSVVKPPEGAIVGGHAMLCVGYDDAARQFIVRNSWGTGWGQGGYCYFSYDYLCNPSLVADVWAIQATET